MKLRMQNPERPDLPNGRTARYERAATYLLLTLAFYITLTIVDEVWLIRHHHYFAIWARRAADAMLLALPVWFLHRKRWLFPWIVLVNLYLLSNVWYYRIYYSIMPLNSYLMVNNLRGLGPSICASMRASDLWIVLPSVCFAAGYSLFGRRIPGGGGKCRRAAGCAASLLLIVVTVIPPYFNDPNEFKHPWPWYRNEIMLGLHKYGLIGYWSYQIAYLHGCSSEEAEYAARFVEAAERRASREPLTEDHRKNLIVVLAESLGSWPIGLEIDGTEATPFMNSLARDTSVLYFPRVLPQVKDGRSSDAQLMLNTGLLPLESGAAASLYGCRNTYPSLPKALARRGYTSASLICDSRHYWNQEATTKSYGFDRYHYELSRGPMRRADEELYENGLEILKELPQPFYAQLVTMSGHGPYAKSDLESPLNNADIPDEEAKYYLVATQYVDRCLGRFIDSLKTFGLYDRSIIVIMGDHDSITRNQYEGRKKRELSDRYIPLFILNAPLKAETGKVIAQIDIYPSLLDLMHAQDYDFHGLGESVFRRQSDCAADHSEGWVGGNRSDSVRQYRKELWRVSDILLRTDYFESRL